MAGAPVHVALAAFDIAKSGDPAKTNDIQQAAISAVRFIVRDAVDCASIGWPQCRWLDRGDGGVLVAPAKSESRVVDPLVFHLAAGLRRYNRRTSDLAHIRLRMAAHSGPVHLSHYGVTGVPMVQLARLLDAPPLRLQLDATSADLAVLVSDSLYDRIVRHDYGLIDPAAFCPVGVEVKETSTRAWLLVCRPALESSQPSESSEPSQPSGSSQSSESSKPSEPSESSESSKPSESSEPSSRDHSPRGSAERSAAGPGGPPAGTHVSIGAVHGTTVVGPVSGVDSLAGRDVRQRYESAEPR